MPQPAFCLLLSLCHNPCVPARAALAVLVYLKMDRVDKAEQAVKVGSLIKHEWPVLQTNNQIQEAAEGGLVRPSSAA
eukprot:1157412-Pelagomonas_calceolata.AAC.2